MHTSTHTCTIRERAQCGMETEFGIDVQAVGSEVRGVFSFLIPLPPRTAVYSSMAKWRALGGKRHRSEQVGSRDDGPKQISLGKYESIGQSRWNRRRQRAEPRTDVLSI